MVSSRSINLNFEVFPLKEEVLIQAGQYETNPEIYLYLLVDTFDATLLEMMEKERTFSRIVNLSNPPGQLMETSGDKGIRLSKEVREKLIEAAIKGGNTPLPDGKIPYRFGPDGKTPMVMKPNILAAQGPNSKAVDITVHLEFQTTEAASTASKYISSSDFKVEQKGRLVEASLKAPDGLSVLLWDEFSRLAKKLNGEVASVGTSEEL